MNPIIQSILDFLVGRLGTEGVLLILLVALLIYALTLRGRYSVLSERLRLMDERRQAMAEDLKRVSALKGKRPGIELELKRPPKARGSLIFFIVEDDDSLRLALAEAIHDKFETAQIVTAQDGVVCMKYVSMYDPSVLLIDLAMPRKTGWEVIEELTAMDKRFPILVSTAYSTTAEGIDEIAPKYAGPKALLQKPYTRQQLYFAIRELLSTSH